MELNKKSLMAFLEKKFLNEKIEFVDESLQYIRDQEMEWIITKLKWFL